MSVEPIGRGRTPLLHLRADHAEPQAGRQPRLHARSGERLNGSRSSDQSMGTNFTLRPYQIGQAFAMNPLPFHRHRVFRIDNPFG
jgi:hypothetical protein